MSSDNDVKEALRRIKESTPEYPPELKTATKAEYTTRVRTMKKDRKGCPLMILTLLVKFALLSGVFQILTS